MHRTILRTLLAASCLVAAAPALAVGTVTSPNVVKGELEFEYFGSTTFDNDSAKDNEQEHEFEIEYGLTDGIGLEFGMEFEKEPGEKTRSSTFEIAGRFQFFEQGENWLDSGLKLAYAHATLGDDADAIEAELLLEKQTGKFVHRANLGLEQEIGTHAEGGPEQSVAWSSRYLYSEYFEPGFEIHSDFGKTNEDRSFDEQEHYIGPAAYGNITPQIAYEVGYFFGASDATPDGAARIKLEYEIYF